VWGSTVDGFFAVGDRGTVLFFDGNVWRPVSIGRGLTGAPNQAFWSVTGLPGVAVGVVGAQDVIGYEGAAWSPSALPTAETIYAVWGDRSDDVFAVGRNGTILHHDGLVWTSQASPVAVDLRTVWGTASNDVYAAGDDLTLLHYDGVSWTVLHAGPAGSGGTGDFTSVFPIGPATVIAGATSGVFTYASGALTRDSMSSTRAVWATSATDVWAATASGVLHSTGAGWVSAGLPTQQLALSGTTSSDVYAVGASSFHFGGTAWAAGPFDDPALAAVSASVDLGVFAAGQHGALQYWSGTALEPMVSRAATNLHAVQVIGNLVFMAGDDGALQTMIFHR
jgi:hypothetical protein